MNSVLRKLGQIMQKDVPLHMLMKKDHHHSQTVGESELDSSFNISLFPIFTVNSP